MDKRKRLQLQLRICLVAMVISILISVIVAPFQYAKPTAVIRVDEDRELMLNQAREHLINAKTKEDMQTRVKYYNSRDYIFKDPRIELRNKKEQQVYSQEVSRQRGNELLGDEPLKGAADNSVIVEQKLKEKTSGKAKSLSDSFMKGFKKDSNQNLN